MDNAGHRHHMELSNAGIPQNHQVLVERNCQGRCSLPLMPGVNEDAVDITATGKPVAVLPGMDCFDCGLRLPAVSAKYRKLHLSSSLPKKVFLSSPHYRHSWQMPLKYEAMLP
jgi:pyruvate-formate lyase-activating enzyme